MISKLTLQNFRCFQNFTLDGIRPITLIAGANNVGKSTILEGIFLFVDRNASDVFLKLNGFRGLYQVSISPDIIWESLFANLNTNNSIVISAVNDEELQTITVSKDNSHSSASIPKSVLHGNTNGLANTIVNHYALKLVYCSDSQPDAKSRFLLTETGVTLIHDDSTIAETSFIYYLSSRISVTSIQLAEYFGKIDIAGNRIKCIELLQLLEPRIKDVSVIVIGGISGIYIDIGLSSKISINMLGDGINKLMQIVLIALANPNCIMLIDEIENGFHYSFLPKLWEIIAKLSQDTGCQIFATTHSYECIASATAIAANDDLFRFIRLDKIDDTVAPKVFDSDSFAYAIKNEWEVR